MVLSSPALNKDSPYNGWYNFLIHLTSAICFPLKSSIIVLSSKLITLKHLLLKSATIIYLLFHWIIWANLQLFILIILNIFLLYKSHIFIYPLDEEQHK